MQDIDVRIVSKMALLLHGHEERIIILDDLIAGQDFEFRDLFSPNISSKCKNERTFETLFTYVSFEVNHDFQCKMRYIKSMFIRQQIAVKCK